MHRLLAGTKKGQDTDHINHDRLDNRRCNLRVCTRSQNKMNVGLIKSNKTGFIGVSYNKRDEIYQAGIAVNNKSIYLGQFKCPKKAAKAYNKAALKHHGEFANVNAI